MAPLRALATAATAAVAAAQSANMLFTQNESVAVYTQVAAGLHAFSPPTFAAATWLNQPVFIESYATNGDVTWTYPGTTTTIYAVDMARHVLSSSSGPSVDTFGLSVQLGGIGCAVYGFYSEGPNANGQPTWSYPLQQCFSDSLPMGAEDNLQASDDGSAVAFLWYANETGGPLTARASVFDGQTGALRFTYDLGPNMEPGGGQIQISGDGNLVAFVYENSTGITVFVLDAVAGTLRGTVPGKSSAAADISDSGNWVVVGDSNAAHFYQWDNSTNMYTETQTVMPSGSDTWYGWDVQVSTDDSATEMAIIGWINDDSLIVRITAFDLNAGTLLTDWTSVPNTKLQNSPTIRADRNYIGVSLWGDVDDQPTCVLLQAGSNNTLFNYTSPGSMFYVDIAVNTSSSQQDVVYLTCGGKAVPANEFGNGGNAYAWEITVPTL